MNESSKVAVLSIGPMDTHQAGLAAILQQSSWLAGTGSRGKVKFCRFSDEAVGLLRSCPVPIVLCDSAAGWREVLDEVRSIPHPPALIVTSRIADDRLWSEALNLGAYDVLAKPYQPDEVVRVLDLAWLRWAESMSAGPQKARCKQPKQLAIPA